MCGRMPVNFQRLRILFHQNAQVGIFLERPGEVDEIAVGFRGQSRICQPRADGLRDIERSRAPGDVLHASIRKLHMNAICHKLRPTDPMNLSVYWRDSGGSNLKLAERARKAGWFHPPSVLYEEFLHCYVFHMRREIPRVPERI